MSFMLVVGKIFHCTDCAESVRIEYTGGAQITQVGDPVERQQAALLEQYGQPLSDPDVNGYYLHNEVICAGCYAAKNDDGQAAQSIFAAMERFDQGVLQIADTVRALIANPTFDDLIAFLGKPVFDELSGRSMLPARKQRKLNEVFQVWHCADDFIKKRINGVIAGLPKPWPDKEVRKLALDLAKKTDTGELTVFTRWDIRATENINPYLLTEFTFRVPEENTPAIDVFRVGSIHLHKIIDEVRISADVVLATLREDQDTLTTAFKTMAHAHFFGQK